MFECLGLSRTVWEGLGGSVRAGFEVSQSHTGSLFLPPADQTRVLSYCFGSMPASVTATPLPAMMKPSL